MKKILLLFSLVLNIALRGMQAGSVAPLSETSDNKKTILKNDYKNFLMSRLKEYEHKTFFSDDIESIENTYREMTNKKSLSFLGNCLHKEVCDEEGNNFVHYAVKHRDTRMIEWTLKCIKFPLSIPNKFNKEPIDLCIDQLMPDASENNKDTAYKGLTMLVEGYDKIGFDYNHRKSFLKKIITLEFEYIKRGVAFPFKNDLLKGFAKQDIQISDIYRQVCDEEGNTFTHMLVSHHLSDMLYSFLIKNYITFALNKQKEDAVTLAQKNLSEVGHKIFAQCVPGRSIEYSPEDNKKKCCYYMLLNMQKKMDGDMEFKQCCDIHHIEKS